MSELRSLARQRRQPVFGVLLSELAVRQSESPTARACARQLHARQAAATRAALSPACAHFARLGDAPRATPRGCNSFNPAVAAMVITHDQSL